MTKCNPLTLNFIQFCIGFSLSHSAVNCVLAFSSTLLGIKLASYGNFMLYLLYSISNLFIARSVLSKFGPKWSVFIGLIGLFFYVFSFFLSLIFPTFQWFIFLLGASIGGIGAGIFWVSQSVYFTLNAQSYDRSINKPGHVYSTYAGYFAFFYLIIEVILQLLAIISYLFELRPITWRIVVFGTATVFAIIGSILIYNILDFSRSNNHDITYEKELEGNQTLQSNSDIIEEVNAFSVIFKIFTCRRLYLILPFQICFGLSAGFFNAYVNHAIVANTYGSGYVGLLTATSLLASSLSTYPITYVSNLLESRYHVVILGHLCFFAPGLSFVLFSNVSISDWIFVVPLYITHGVARCIWEGANKALVTDYFETTIDREIAFAAVYFVSGISGAFAFGCYQYMSREALAWLNTVVPTISLICFHIGHQIYLSEYRIVSRQNHKQIGIINPFLHSYEDGYVTLNVQEDS